MTAALICAFFAVLTMGATGVWVTWTVTRNDKFLLFGVAMGLATGLLVYAAVHYASGAWPELNTGHP